MASRQNSINSIGSSAQSSVISFASVDYNPETLEPCAATARLFLYSQGTSVVCLQYETLQVERRFERHSDDITIIAAESTGDDATVHRVVTVDKGKLAIVWDANTGEEISRFAAYEDIRVAAWMKNGNLAFGDSMGNVILFDPTRSESISARTIFDPLTSIAPSADCKTFALGYSNGSILVAALSPSFTILHTLTTTSLAPSPVVTLAWHASSARQKSDMLATQTRDGDVRVWSVPKTLEGDDTARVVRVLKRDGSNRRGNNWLGWSRNGRIVHYSDGAATIWDVRTKKVSWDDIPVLDNAAGICVYGAKGALFTRGKDNTVQQFTLYPPTLMANVHQVPSMPPPSPPVSIEEKKEEEPLYNTTYQAPVEQYPPVEPLHPHSMEEEEHNIETMSPLGRIAHELEQLEKMEHRDGGLGISNIPRERAASVSSRSSQGSVHQRPATNSARSSGELSQGTTASNSRKGSIGATSLTSPRKQHPLRQEIHPSPEQPQVAQIVASSPIAEVTDIFPNLRQRIGTVVYESPRIGSPNTHLSGDDLRREMLWCIFGWKGDIEGLLQDELDSINARSLNAVLLRMWLGDLDQNSLAVLLGADFNVGGDWLFLALSAMGGQQSWHHVVRAFVMRLLQKGDLHLAVLCLLALGDKNDAVEVYVSHKRYMEAVLLTALLFKEDWKRQSQLVRKWGQHASEHYEGGLAARCFACADTEPPAERPAPPKRSASHSRSRSETESLSNFVRGLSISAPSNPRTTLKMTPKNSPLKLITSFEDRQDPIPRSATTSPPAVGVNRFFSGGGPRSATSTPIAMSALTPIDPFWQNDMFPSSARTITPGPAKLEPVTESSPADATPKADHIDRLQPPLPEERDVQISSPIEARNSSGFHESKPVTLGQQASRNASPAPPVPRIPSPPTRRTTPPQMSGPPTGSLPDPPSSVFNREHKRKGSTQRKPAGLQIQWPPIDGVLREGTPPASGSPPRPGHQRKGSLTTPPPPVPPMSSIPAAQKSPGSIDRFLDLLENSQKRLDSQRAAPRGTPKLRGGSPDRRPSPQVYELPANTSANDVLSEVRGRQEARVKKGHMRSPSSPLPMSDQAKLYRDDPEDDRPEPPPEPLEDTYYGDTRGRTRSRTPNTTTMRSPSPSMSPEEAQYRHDDESEPEEEYEDERYYTHSPRREPSRGRGRSNTLDVPANSHMRSPSSPLPMGPQAQLYKDMADDIDDAPEYHRRPPRPARTDSRTRGPRNESIPRHLNPPHGLRRSRSERTLRQWSDKLERVGTAELRNASPAPSSLSRNASVTRGLPANPRAWRAELQAESRSNSPAPPARGRSPSIAPAPPAPSQTPRRAMSPLSGRDVSPMSRAMSPMSRTMSPMSRTMSPMERTMSPPRGLRDRSVSRPGMGSRWEAENAIPTAFGARRGTEPTIPTPRPANYYYPAAGFDYESLPTSPQNGGTPTLPPLPTLNHSPSLHQRSQSDQPSTFKPLIRKLPPQPPPDSPPPLPIDMPVHPLLQINFDPQHPGRRTVRRVKRSDELITAREEEQSIIVGIESEEARPWEGGPIEIAVPPRRPSAAGYRMAPSPPMRGFEETIGSMNQI